MPTIDEQAAIKAPHQHFNVLSFYDSYLIFSLLFELLKERQEDHERS
jgi:hypothetical protein